ncbi:hypothetical protein HDU91_002895, partial [Kappamyces sp. JEL0680]
MHTQTHPTVTVHDWIMLGIFSAALLYSLSTAVPADTTETAYCPVLVDDFNDILDTNVWTQDLTLSGGGNWEFEWYTNNRSNAFTDNGVLYLKPTYTSDLLGADKVVNGGTIDLWSEGCTGNGFYGCQRSSNGVNILNPIQSALLRTKNSASIKYGKIEVRAKLPIGDWLWPAIWLLPKSNAYGGWPASGEIDIMESRGNAPGCPADSTSCQPGRDTFASTLHWGADFYTNRYELTHKSYTLPNGQSFSDDFHTFGLIWDETGLTTYVDSPSNVVLNVPFNNFCQKGNFASSYKCPWPANHPAAPFDQEFYLIMNVAA